MHRGRPSRQDYCSSRPSRRTWNAFVTTRMRAVDKEGEGRRVTLYAADRNCSMAAFQDEPGVAFYMDSVADLITLAAHTGARIEELCNLKFTHVNNDIISIPGTKTDAALRKVPAHSAIGDLLVRLVTSSKDGYLIPGRDPEPV